MTLFLILLLGLQTPNEAEDLFKKTEAKLLAARTLHLEASVTVEGEPPFRAWLLVAEGNKVSLGVDKVVRPPKFRNLLSDGKEVREHTMGFPPARAAAPAGLAAGAVLLATRHDFFEGVKVGLGTGWLREGADIASKVKLSDFRLGKAEKSGDRTLQPIEFARESEVLKDRPPVRSQVTLWIDKDTLLPVRRRVVRREGTGGVTESFETVAIDKEIDFARFILPKD